jgi:geranylgeranyl diphosphate synthase type II
VADVWRELRPRLDAFDTGFRALVTGLTADVPMPLRQAIEYSLFAGGKRLRAMLCGLACEAVGGRFEHAAVAGCAVEMIHTYSLIHDDLPAMDDDDLRRGRPTCHKVYGDALAILAGDALQPMAFEAIAAGYSPAAATVMMAELARGAGAAGMVGGQVLDLMEDGRVPGERIGPDRERLDAIHLRKTGALFRSALRMGVIAGGGRDKDTIDRYAASFGLLFQVTDDLLDVESTSEATGKATGKDSARGKLTYPGLIGIAASRESAMKLANDCIASAMQFGDRGRLLGELAMSMVERKA